MKNKMEIFLQQNFVSIWHHFLTFEINRSKFAVETWGSGNAYLIFQVIAWHHILVMTDEADSQIRDDAVKLWFDLTKTGFKTRTILTYSLISSLTSLSIETIRRHVKKLEKNYWVSYSKKDGVKFNLTKSSLDLSVNNTNSGDGKESLSVKFDHDLEISFNSRYLIDVATQLDGEKVEIYFNDTGSPALIKDPGDFDSIFVVMPMKG